MSSSFCIRKLNVNSLSKFKIKQEVKILVEPPKVQFTNYELNKNNIAKVVLKNNSQEKLKFKIQQPKRSIFQIRNNKNFILPGQNIQIFLFFNPQKQKITCTDSFTIQFQKQTQNICVPIIVCLTNHRLVLRSLTTQNHNSQNRNASLFTNELLTQQPSLNKNNSKESQTQIDSAVQDYLKKFEQISAFVKDKYIKTEVFIGEKKPTKEQINKIKYFSLRMNLYMIQSIKQKAINRYKVQFSRQRPIIYPLPNHLLLWDQSRNDPKMIYQKALNKINKEVSKLVNQYRFQKVHRSFLLYQQFQKSHQQLSISEAKKHQYYCQKLKRINEGRKQSKIQLEFDRQMIEERTLKVNHDTTIFKTFPQFSINPRISFDDWLSIDQSIRFNHQIMNYKRCDQLQSWLCFPSVTFSNYSQSIFYRSCSLSLPFPIISQEQPLVQPLSQQVKIMETLNVQNQFYQEQQQQFIAKSIAITKQSISILDRTNHDAGYLHSQHNQQNNPYLQRYLNCQHKIIGRICRQDQIDEKEFEQKYQRRIELAEKYQAQKLDISISNYRQTEQIDFQNILENIKIVKTAQHAKSELHVKSFNNFISEQKNKLFI